MAQKTTDDLCINTLRFLAVDAVQKANSGHPGMPMGDAAMAYVLWSKFLKHNPNNPNWANRDRFVLSAGHGSMLLYSLLHLTGYKLSLDDLKNFRQWGSPTAGHPEYEPSLGIEMTTGPLGQGFATGIGMAMAEKYLADRYNKKDFKLFDYNIYGITSDGDLMEGVSTEAASIAGHLGLGKIVYLYSANQISIEGSTDITFTEDIEKKFEALNWDVQKVDGNDLSGLEKAITNAKNETKKPSLVICRTHIGYGSPAKQDSASSHGSPLGDDEIKATKQNLRWPLEPSFHIPDEALEEYRSALTSGEKIEKEWNELLGKYMVDNNDLAEEIRNSEDIIKNGKWKDDLPKFDKENGTLATRAASGKILNAISDKTPFLVGGSADLAPSNNTELKNESFFTADKAARNIHYGVREHAMGAIMNGMALSGKIVPFGGTFLVFSDYLKPAIRLASLMKTNVVYVFTHDSIGLGEDGPTHQPIEHLASLRSIPNLTVIRPADSVETCEAWQHAITNNGPTALILTRQSLPFMDRAELKSQGNVSNGGYIVTDNSQDGKSADIIFIATGSEVQHAVSAAEELKNESITARVVSMPSWEIYESQSDDYKESVLPKANAKRISMEAGSTQGWHKYTGLNGVTIGIDRFGASAPASILMEKFGFTTENLKAKAKELLGK